MVTWLMGLAARCHCRAAPPTPRLRPITLSDRSCSCWIGLRQSRNLTALELHARSDSRFPYSSTAEESAQLGEMAEHPPFYLPSRSGPCDNIFKRKKPSAAVK